MCNFLLLLQIAAFGMEKIVPDRASLGVFTRLLARSATGQPITSYTSHYRRPREGGELHIVIVDNEKKMNFVPPPVFSCIVAMTKSKIMLRKVFALSLSVSNIPILRKALK